MNEEQAEKRRRRSQAEIEQLVAAFESEGTGREEFCRSHGLAQSTLARYQRRQRMEQREGAGRWLALEVAAPGQAGAKGPDSGLALVLSGGRRIEVGIGFDAATLGQLLRVLERA